MNGRAKLAIDAMNRLEKDLPLTDEQKALIRPRLQREADKGAYTWIKQSGFYVVNNIYFEATSGFDHQRIILMQSSATYKSNRSLSAVEVYSGGTLSEYGMTYSGSADEFGDTGFGQYVGKLNDGDSIQASARDEYYDDSTKRMMVCEVERLRARGDTRETNTMLAFYEDELGITTFRGRVKGFVSEAERARQNVRKALTKTWDMLDEENQTAHIAADLRKNTQTGNRCEYVGHLTFRFE